MKRSLVIRTIGLWGLFVIFLVLTNPNDVPVLGLIIPFGLFGLALFTTWQVVFSLFFQKTQKKGRSFAHARLLGLFITIVSVFCLGLASLGELTVKDFFTLLQFAVVGFFYVVRAGRSTK